MYSCGMILQAAIICLLLVLTLYGIKSHATCYVDGWHQIKGWGYDFLSRKQKKKKVGVMFGLGQSSLLAW